MKYFTEQQARKLAKHDKSYRARHVVSIPEPNWIVWDDTSDHNVEFDQATVEHAQ